MEGIIPQTCKLRDISCIYTHQFCGGRRDCVTRLEGSSRSSVSCKTSVPLPPSLLHWDGAGGIHHPKLSVSIASCYVFNN